MFGLIFFFNALTSAIVTFAALHIGTLKLGVDCLKKHSEKKC